MTQVWLFDASKQAIGAGVAHAANIAIAIALVGYTDTGTTDECAMYFVNFSLDTSLGVVFNWMLLTLVTTAAATTAIPFESGDAAWTRYCITQRVCHRVWLLQLLSWLGVILTAKLLIGRGIVYFQAGLVAYAAWVFAPLEGHPRVELIVVMVACPCLMNALQFWVKRPYVSNNFTSTSG
ncbi:hypothetical protein DYB32_001253 [Aphanomyces invadans]|uniref:Uncharacterized protein n=1 Tax=Aphanomyces invadans TaxID=157072 RepID=A0A3R7D5Z3_9STRA|nr:hypothetical protein DYB32_001253 [Aphanomyces invadans]